MRGLRGLTSWTEKIVQKVQWVQEGVEDFQPLQKVGSIFRDARFTMLDNIYDFVPFYAFNTKRQTPNVLDTGYDFVPFYAFNTKRIADLMLDGSSNNKQ